MGRGKKQELAKANKLEPVDIAGSVPFKLSNLYDAAALKGTLDEYAREVCFVCTL